MKKNSRGITGRMEMKNMSKMEILVEALYKRISSIDMEMHLLKDNAELSPLDRFEQNMKLGFTKDGLVEAIRTIEKLDLM